MPTVHGKQLVFNYLRDEEVSQMNKVLVEHDIPVIRIEEHKKSLEDIFLDLTGKERSL
jgi:ABC-2 type transport system ATP-binding protein